MKLVYEGVDITSEVHVRKCVYREAGGGRLDSLDIELENAERWYRWKPQRDDHINASLDSLSTGMMYLQSIVPENGKFRLLATSAPSVAVLKRWASFEKTTLKQIMDSCSAELGMSAEIYGLDENAVYPYLLRKDETCTAFLTRLLEWEGATLKCVSGRLAAIAIDYAQGQRTSRTISLLADQQGIMYCQQDRVRWAGVTVKTPHASASAVDTAVNGIQHKIFSDLPARDAVTAGRWARGMLLTNNRKAETLQIAMTFDAALCALVRIDIQADENLGGKWLTADVEHDLKNEKTSLTLRRCIETIR